MRRARRCNDKSECKKMISISPTRPLCDAKRYRSFLSADIFVSKAPPARPVMKHCWRNTSRPVKRPRARGRNSCLTGAYEHFCATWKRWQNISIIAGIGERWSSTLYLPLKYAQRDVFLKSGHFSSSIENIVEVAASTIEASRRRIGNAGIYRYLFNAEIHQWSSDLRK